MNEKIADKAAKPEAVTPKAAKPDAVKPKAAKPAAGLALSTVGKGEIALLFLLMAVVAGAAACVALFA